MKIYFSRVNFPKLLFTHRYAESTQSAARAKSKLDAESYVNKTESLAFASAGALKSRLPRTQPPRALWVPVLFPPRPLCSAAPGSSFRNFSLFSRDCLQASYDQVYRASVQEPENLWSEAAGDINWFKPWSKTMDNANPPFTNW
ncbi:hypothetical protein NDU88_004711 [Pleurodeles waltl]|uniref:Acetyl-coenzyme A synthetase N-terminal domain-containing protein n=2 Tax=Pleurodeles waltl TaxID=8319 RepID=A0AAV7SJK6_PLEWA|nr:hypothetical protein NDU88_004711 [Pleurodeles waltl]